MPIPPKKIYRIREVAEILNVPNSTLRHWELSFDALNPRRTPSGQRIYTNKDIEICRKIIFLTRDKGISIECANKELNNYRKYPPRRYPSCNSTKDALKLLEQAKNGAEDSHTIARIESVIAFLSKKVD